MLEQHTIRQALANFKQAARTCAEQVYAQYVEVIGRKPAPMLAVFRSQIIAGQVYVATGEKISWSGSLTFFQWIATYFLENVAESKARRAKSIGKSLVRFCGVEVVRLGYDCVQLYTNVKLSKNCPFILDWVVSKSSGDRNIAEPWHWF